MAVFAGLGPVDPISGILAGGVAAIGGEGPLPSLSGFDAVLQFGGRTLQAQIASSLGQLNLSASVPWGSIALPASFLALIPPLVRNTLSERLAYIELTLTAPYVAALRWPTSLIVGTGGVGLAAGAEVVAPPPREQRFVDIGWELAINITTPVAGTAPSFLARAPGQGTGTGAGGAAAGGGAGASSAGSGTSGGPPLATGAAITTARAAAAVRSDIWVFSEQLDFSAMTPSATSSTQGVADFLATAGGQTLLNQAVASLKTLAGVSLSPEVAPAGSVAPAVVQSVGLPALQVTDILLQDAKGNSVLCLCAALGGSSGGVIDLVQPLLETSDFAYAASAKLLGYALKARWTVGASGISVVGETQVELGTQGETGLAKVMVTFGALTDVEIVAVADGSGDVLRLLGNQTIQLLELWDQNGNQVTNLGALAKAQTQPFVLAVNYFNSGSGPPSLQANFENLVLQLMVVVGFPILDAFSIDASSVTGFTSSPLQANLVRWALTQTGGVPPVGKAAP
jgi:hypothetical protein